MIIRLLLLTLLSSPLVAQDLAFSLAGPASGPEWPRTEGEILQCGAPGATVAFWPAEALHVFFGDRDGNGFVDDGDVDIDALHLGSGRLADLRFSLTATTAIPNRPTMDDGDVLSIGADGAPALVHAEAEFAAWTGCGNVDVDAYAEAPDGTVWFSFADDETTTDPRLVAQNGGQSRLDEQTLFVRPAGRNDADVALTKSQVVAIFNRAAGSGARSVVDLSGVTMDPNHPGELLLTSTSGSSTLVGRVVSTFQGGTPHRLQGQAVDATTLGLPAGTRLDALATLAAPAPPRLRLTVPEGSSATGGPSAVRIANLLPGETAQLVVTRLGLAPGGAYVEAQAVGLRTVWNDPTDPSFWSSWQAAPWSLVAGMDGRASYAFDFAGLAPNTSVVATAFLPGRFELSNPVVLRIHP